MVMSCYRKAVGKNNKPELLPNRHSKTVTRDVCQFTFLHHVRLVTWSDRWCINHLKPSGYFTYHQGLTFKNSTWRSLCVECFVRISEQTATFALYSINWLAFITVVESVYCAVRTGSLNKAVCA